jgi:hypothetical protein
MKTGEENTEKGNQNEKEQQNAGNDQVMNLVKQLQQEIAALKSTNQPISAPTNGLGIDDITKIIQASVNTRDRDLNYEAGIKEEDIPVDDFIEPGVRFCAPFVGYVIVDDRRKGHRVLLPYNKPSIFFEYGATRRIQQGKYEAVAPYSVYTSKSKKEIQWLRDHSHYNIFFYESSTAAVGADVIRMQKTARVMTVLQHYTLHDLIKRCREYNVAPSEDPASMRSQLVQVMVDVEIKSEQSATERILSETHKHMILAGKRDE